MKTTSADRAATHREVLVRVEESVRFTAAVGIADEGSKQALELDDALVRFGKMPARAHGYVTTAAAAHHADA